MQKSNLLIAVLLWCSCLLGLPAVTEAQSKVPHGKFGLGAEAMITGLAGAAFVYDPSPFRLEAIFAYQGRRDDTFWFAGRFFYVLHSHSAADFSLGGSLGLEHFSPEDDDAENNDRVHLEGAAQIRAFIVPQVALSGTLGIGVVFEDEDNDPNADNTILINGQLTGALGVVYFF